MANVVEVVIQGKDTSSGAFQAAAANAARLGREVKTMTGTFTAAAGVLSAFGNNTLSNLAAQAAMTGSAIESASRSIKGIPVATLARWGLIGAAIAGVTYTVSGYTEKLERQSAAEEKVGEALGSARPTARAPMKANRHKPMPCKRVRNLLPTSSVAGNAQGRRVPVKRRA